MGHPVFSDSDFLEAAQAIAAEHGPSAVTVASVTARIKAPVGSFYHRFKSLDVLLAHVWLMAVDSFQAGFIEAIDAQDGRRAALHTATWSRANLNQARLLLLYDKQDFLAGRLPKPLAKGFAAQLKRVTQHVRRFATHVFGSCGTHELYLVRYALAHAPVAAVRPFLVEGKKPPTFVDAVIESTYQAVIERKSLTDAVRGVPKRGSRKRS